MNPIALIFETLYVLVGEFAPVYYITNFYFILISPWCLKWMVLAVVKCRSRLILSIFSLAFDGFLLSVLVKWTWG